MTLSLTSTCSRDGVAPSSTRPVIFEATVACYERLFGAGNVRLFAYEQLRAEGRI